MEKKIIFPSLSERQQALSYTLIKSMKVTGSLTKITAKGLFNQNSHYLLHSHTGFPTWLLNCLDLASQILPVSTVHLCSQCATQKF